MNKKRLLILALGTLFFLVLISIYFYQSQPQSNSITNEKSSSEYYGMTKDEEKAFKKQVKGWEKF
tara:strand:+ start:1326 stop:1520 length:195 start_codon:yes stop_codon:yes gene_type:complete